MEGREETSIQQNYDFQNKMLLTYQCQNLITPHKDML